MVNSSVYLEYTHTHTHTHAHAHAHTHTHTHTHTHAPVGIRGATTCWTLNLIHPAGLLAATSSRVTNSSLFASYFLITKQKRPVGGGVLSLRSMYRLSSDLTAFSWVPISERLKLNKSQLESVCVCVCVCVTCEGV